MEVKTHIASNSKNFSLANDSLCRKLVDGLIHEVTTGFNCMERRPDKVYNFVGISHTLASDDSYVNATVVLTYTVTDKEVIK